MATAGVTSDAVWPLVRLGDAVEVVNGGTPKSKVAEYWGGEHQWLTPADMGKMAGREIDATPRTITSEGLAKSSARLVPPNSVILSTRAPIGHLAINETPMAFNQGCRGLVPSKDVDHLFLYYFLMANRNLLDDLGSGTTFKELSATNLKAVSMPLPAVEVQKRIVAVLDQAFAALDRARANAEANLADAAELHPTFVTSLISEHSGDWPASSLGDIYDVRDGTHDSPKYQASGRPLITSKNLGSSGLNFDKVKFISDEDFISISRRSAVHKGDVLFAMIGTIGNPVVVEVEPDFAIKNVALFKMKNGRSGALLRHMLSSKMVAERMSSGAKGTTQRFVGLGYLRAFELRIPPVEDEQDIVTRLDESEVLSRKLQSCCLKKIEDIAELRQSLLQRAFAGELT